MTTTIPLAGAPAPFTEIALPLPDERVGKVRASYALPDERRLFVTTDRLSAFDRILGGAAYKGQVLNELSAFWFDRTADAVPNHVVSVPDPNVLIARAATPLPVEVIVRGYITGVTSTSLWTRYASGARVIDGYTLPDGIRKNTALPAPIITPTTKGDPFAAGGHDEPLSCAEVVERGLVDPGVWQRTMDAALELFRRGQQIAGAAGLILADTKYEFGLDVDGGLLLIDEVHTPDSSRLWVGASYEARLAAGEEPESLDKEVVRRALADAGYRGDGDPPHLDDDVWKRTSERYIDAFERITGSTFHPGSYPVAERITTALEEAGIL